MNWFGTTFKAEPEMESNQSSLLDVIGDLIIIAHVQDINPRLVFQLWLGKRNQGQTIGCIKVIGLTATRIHTRTCHWVVVRWPTRAKSGLSTKRRKKRGAGWLVWSWSLVERKVDNLPEDMPIRNTSRITQNKCQSNPIPLEVSIGYQNNCF